MGKLSSLDRNEQFESLKNEIFDVIIIGGGITGAGIALDAVTRGMNTALIEMQDFAGGTSSRSTKLVHGGLRYLQQFKVKMVAEVGSEREIVYENGPHVTTPEWMLLPYYKGSNLGPWTASIGLRVYDFLAGVKRTERRKMLSSEEALVKEPLIKSHGLKGAGFYVEYKTDDARLTLEVIKKAVDYGARAMNYVKATGFLYNDDHCITGVFAIDEITGKSIEIKGKKIINATGPWVDTVREVDCSKVRKTLLHTKGVHLVFDQSVFSLRQAVYFDGPDHRMIFAVPRLGKTYVGTTDTFYEGSFISPLVTKEDRDYLLTAIQFMFPGVKIGKADVESSWAGLRPLIAEKEKGQPGKISRKDEIIISDSGLVSIAGGKLTGYRKMAEQVVDKIAELLKKEEGILYSSSITKKIPISGGSVGGSFGFKNFSKLKFKQGVAMGLSETECDWLIRTYGANVDELFALYESKEVKATDLNINSVLLTALIYSIENEAVYKPSDFLVRRTGALYFRIDIVKEYKNQITNYLAGKLGWTEKQRDRYLFEVNKLLMEATTFV